MSQYNENRNQSPARSRSSLATVAAMTVLTVLCFTLGCQDGAREGAPDSASNDVGLDAGAAASGEGYTVTIGIAAGTGELGAVQFDVTNTPAGSWEGARDKVACTNVSGAAMMACNNKGKAGLSCALIDPNGIVLPKDLIECNFLSTTVPSAADFSVHVVDASDKAMQAVDVEITVTSIKGS